MGRFATTGNFKLHTKHNNAAAALYFCAGPRNLESDHSVSQKREKERRRETQHAVFLVFSQIYNTGD